MAQKIRPLARGVNNMYAIIRPGRKHPKIMALIAKRKAAIMIANSMHAANPRWRLQVYRVVKVTMVDWPIYSTPTRMRTRKAKCT